ncbi:peroxiredoxin [Leucobacter sp. M11]|uniref:peroxiredoxin n=1 Tax=Leucobacter sp. M11 TaxID=2993565 RepID=UPI002D7F32EC|nr:peroxiredoxin [Leucobacter sp. M11]MEB4615539.1 peroxiredoxin [Leucobacter sp. M11]
MTDRTLLTAGDPAPDFTLTDQNGTTHTLSELRGTGVVLFFYPAAMTPGCTTEACDFRDSVAGFAEAGYRVFGISKDTVEKQLRFAERDSLDYPLLSDPELGTHIAYGAYGDKMNYGKVVQGVIRSTFVIGADGAIEHALYNIKATGHVARVKKLLGIGA